MINKGRYFGIYFLKKEKEISEINDLRSNQWFLSRK